MPVDIIGMITATPGAEVDVPGGAAVQPDYVRRFAQALQIVQGARVGHVIAAYPVRIVGTAEELINGDTEDFPTQVP